MELTRILVGTDFSEQAEPAFEQAVHIARRTGADVVLAFATPDRAAIERAGREPLLGLDDYPQMVRERIAAKLGPGGPRRDLSSLAM